MQKFFYNKWKIFFSDRTGLVKKDRDRLSEIDTLLQIMAAECKFDQPARWPSLIGSASCDAMSAGQVDVEEAVARRSPKRKKQINNQRILDSIFNQKSAGT